MCDYETYKAHLKKEYPEMPDAQIESIATFCGFSGWEWVGFGANGSVDIQRAASTETTDRAYIRTDGTFRYT